MPPLCFFCLDPVARTDPRDWATHPLFFVLCPFPAPAMSILALVLKGSPPVDVAAMWPGNGKREHVPYDCGPGCWLDNPELPLSLSLLLVSLFRALDAYSLSRSLFLTPALSLSLSLSPPSIYLYICT